MKKIKYGIIGFGWAGKTHATVLNNILSKKVKILSICDINTQKLNEAKKIYQVKTTKNYQEMFDMKLDAISICTPHHLHFPMAKALIKANIPFLIEKPTVILYDEIKQLRSILKKQKITAGTILQHRYEYANQLVKNAIQNGELGELISTSINVKWEKNEEYYKDWHGNKSMCGGGVLITQAIHMFDLASWFNNGVKSIYGKMKFSRRLSVEDNVIGLLEYNSGGFGVIDCSTSTKPGFGSTIEIIGSKNSVKLHNGSIIYWGGKSFNDIKHINKMIKKVDMRTWKKKYFGYGHIFQIKNFISSVIEKAPILVTIEDGLQVVEVILAFERSSKTHKEVIINERKN